MFVVKQASWESYEKEITLLRDEVLHVEQGFVPELIHDGLDGDAFHIIVKRGNQLIGACRLLKVNEDKLKLGRMIVKKNYRNIGVGSEIMKYIFDRIIQLETRISIITMEAQKQAKLFYENHECVVVSEEYEVCNISHFVMEWRRKT